jgi:hypothetical protein
LAAGFAAALSARPAGSIGNARIIFIKAIVAAAASATGNNDSLGQGAFAGADIGTPAPTAGTVCAAIEAANALLGFPTDEDHQ